MFATGMKRKWDCRVYLDLFAGAGRARIDPGGQIVPASPLLALEIPDPFDLYVFCEQDPVRLDALRARCLRLAEKRHVAFVEGDANAQVTEVLAQIPRGRRGYRVLTYCVADPFKVRDLHFETIRQIASRYADFFVLIPSYMDANRNEAPYTRVTDTGLDSFFGTRGWRAAWDGRKCAGGRFGDFVADFFGGRMAGLGFRYRALEEMILVRSTDKNLPLYHLAFFSRHEQGYRFWAQARKYSEDQLDLFRS